MAMITMLLLMGLVGIVTGAMEGVQALSRRARERRVSRFLSQRLRTF